MTIKCSDITKERWYVIHGDKCDYRMESTKGNYIMLADCIPLEVAKQMAAALELRDALKMVVRRSTLSRVRRGTRDSDTITATFNPDQWRIVTDALKKSAGEMIEEVMGEGA